MWFWTLVNCLTAPDWTWPSRPSYCDTLSQRPSRFGRSPVGLCLARRSDMEHSKQSCSFANMCKDAKINRSNIYVQGVHTKLVYSPWTLYNVIWTLVALVAFLGKHECAGCLIPRYLAVWRSSPCLHFSNAAWGRSQLISLAVFQTSNTLNFWLQMFTTCSVYCSLGEQIAQGIWGTSSCGLKGNWWSALCNRLDCTSTFTSFISALSTFWTLVELRCPGFWSQETVRLVHSHSRKWPTCVLRVLLESQWDRAPFPRPSDKATAWIEILSLDTWFSRYTRVLSLIPLISFSSHTCLSPGRVKDGWKQWQLRLQLIFFRSSASKVKRGFKAFHSKLQFSKVCTCYAAATHPGWSPSASIFSCLHVVVDLLHLSLVAAFLQQCVEHVRN